MPGSIACNWPAFAQFTLRFLTISQPGRRQEFPVVSQFEFRLAIRCGQGRNLSQSQAKNAEWTAIGRSGSVLSQNFIHRFSPRQLIDQLI
jgi:hypothetical protein